jgi:hypothetical protein
MAVLLAFYAQPDRFGNARQAVAFYGAFTLGDRLFAKQII